MAPLGNIGTCFLGLLLATVILSLIDPGTAVVVFAVGGFGLGMAAAAKWMDL